MRSVKKLLKKAMVFTLTAAMLVGTPLTASAAPLNSVYSIWDGTGTWNGHDSGSGTGTVTNTDTNTGALIEGNDAKIIGIVLDKQNLNLEKGDKEPLKATVVLDGKITKDGEDITKAVIAEMSKKIKWEVLYLDENGNKLTKSGDPAAKVGLELNLGKDSDRSTVQLNAKQGTEEGKEVTVRATIDSRYYYVGAEDGGQNTDVALNTSKRPAPYTAETTVSVKEYSDKLAFNGVKDEQYVKHTLDLSEYLVRTPATANDTITWSSSDTKTATVTAAGLVTFKKITSGENKVTITAVGEKGAKATQDFTVSAGTPASKIEVWSTGEKVEKITKRALDLNGNEDENVDVKMYARVKGAVKSKANTKKAAETAEDAKTKGSGYDTGTLEIENGKTFFVVVEGALEEKTLEITDNVAWTTNKATIATVKGNNEDAVITAAGKALGTAKITAKASSGKSANVSVTVKATLASLEIGNIPEKLYSGQSATLTADRTPALNKDAVKWSIEKVKYTDKNGREKEKANPNASISSKGVLTIKPKIDPEYTTVTVVLETKATKIVDGKKVPVFSDKKSVEVVQSSISGFAITDDLGTPVATYKTEYRDDGITVKSAKQTLKNQTTKISVPKGRTYTATVDVPSGQDYAGGADTLVWKSKSEKIAKVESNGDGTAKITAVAAGNTTITVSGVRVDKKADGNIKAVKTISATFKVAVKQPTTSITIKTPSVVVKEANKNASVSLKATQNKNAKETLEWSVVKNGEKNDNAATVTNKGKVTLKKGMFAAGDVFTVTARAKESGVTAKATIKIITPSAGVRVVDPETNKVFQYNQKKGNGSRVVTNATVLDLGESVRLVPEVNVGTSRDPKWQNAATTEDKITTADVTYSVNKKGIVQIIGNTVYRVGNGTVKVTVKTDDGKKYTLTIDDKSKEYVAPVTE